MRITISKKFVLQTTLGKQRKKIGRRTAQRIYEVDEFLCLGPAAFRFAQNISDKVSDQWRSFTQSLPTRSSISQGQFN